MELHLAARYGNFAAVCNLIKTGTDTNLVLKRQLLSDNQVKDFKIDLWTPLHCAVEAQNIKIVKFLINHKANVNAEDEYGQTPLHLAASKGNVKIAKLLLENGAYVDSSKSSNQNDTPKFRIREPLHSAIESQSLSIVKMLLDRNANVHLEDRWNRTPICLSIIEGNSSILELLLTKGADIKQSVDLIDKKNRKTAFHYIAEKLQVKIIKYLSSKYGSKYNEIHKILNLCFYRNFNDCQSCQSDEKLKNVIEIIEEHDKILEMLLMYDSDVNPLDINGATPLYLASKEGNWRIAKTLLENGAEVDLQNDGGKTAFHIALFHKRRAIVEMLLDYEANFLISDNNGLTPLNYQCQFYPEFDLESQVVKIEIFRMIDKEYLTQDVLSHFERQCLNEIFDLKQTKFRIGKFNLSFFEIFLDESLQNLLRLSNNDEFCKVIFSDNFCKQFPNYGDILRGRLIKAKRKNYLIIQGLEPLRWILNYEFPQPVLEDIMSYLENADIMNVIKIYECHDSVIKNQ